MQSPQYTITIGPWFIDSGCGTSYTVEQMSAYIMADLGPRYQQNTATSVTLRDKLDHNGT